MPKIITIEIHSESKATITHEGVSFDVRSIPGGCQLDTHDSPDTVLKLFAESIYEKVAKLSDATLYHELNDALSENEAEELEEKFEF